MSTANTQDKHIAIAGGGFTGMVCALKLLQAGYRVTVLESQSGVGGLTTSFDFGSFRWDKFYHCILTSDTALLGLLDELGLSERMRWTTTEVGFFSHGKLYKLTSPADLLHFPHLSLRNKVRMGLATLYASHIRDGRYLEKISLADWTRKIYGNEVYKEIWEPLFRCKLGEMRHRASAAFLWGTLRRLYSTREKGAGKQEKLGYVKGGYAVVFARLQERVTELGATIQTSTRIESVRSIEADEQDGNGSVEIVSNNGVARFDGAIMTLPNGAIRACLKTEDAAYKARLGEVQYLGMICMVLLLRRRLSPFYVTNITDLSPFTGVIEMTNLIDTSTETTGLHMVYLPRYTSPSDPLFEASDEDVWASFGPRLHRMHPDLHGGDIVAQFVFRERTVQPVPTLNYSEIVPATQTPVAGVYLANTAQIVNSTLNNNVMTTLAQAACTQLMRDLPLRTEPVASASMAPIDFHKGVPCSPSA